LFRCVQYIIIIYIKGLPPRIGWKKKAGKLEALIVAKPVPGSKVEGSISETLS
jgi:hypothetical protein